MNSLEAKKNAETLVNQAIDESKKQGTSNLPQNLGDIVLGDTKANSPIIEKVVKNIQAKLPRKKEEGVRDEDIRRWWNLSDIERRITVKINDFLSLSLYLSTLQHSPDVPEEKLWEHAAAKMRKLCAMFGDPDNETHTHGDDRPLPIELEERIGIYMENRMKTDPHLFNLEVEQSSTFNALIRKEIRAGKI